MKELRIIDELDLSEEAAESLRQFAKAQATSPKIKHRKSVCCACCANCKKLQGVEHLGLPYVPSHPEVAQVQNPKSPELGRVAYLLRKLSTFCGLGKSAKQNLK